MSRRLVGRKAFVKMSERGKWLFLLMDRIVAGLKLVVDRKVPCLIQQVKLTITIYSTDQ